MRAVRVVAVAVSVVCVVCTQSALAATQLGPGIHVDPGSPAGKEYRIPIESARGETSGGPRAAGSSRATTFGYGVTASPTRRSQSGSQTRRAGHGRGQRGTHPGSRAHPSGKLSGGAHAARHSSRAVRAAQLLGSDDGGSGSWLLLVAGGALVLLLGCGGGLALKRRI
jgi:hypothetical protein